MGLVCVGVTGCGVPSHACADPARFAQSGGTLEFSAAFSASSVATALNGTYVVPRSYSDVRAVWRTTASTRLRLWCPGLLLATNARFTRTGACAASS